eukprot:499153-Lingulodinium_polyedra.AAC.1
MQTKRKSTRARANAHACRYGHAPLFTSCGPAESRGTERSRGESRGVVEGSRGESRGVERSR